MLRKLNISETEYAISFFKEFAVMQTLILVQLCQYASN